MPATADSSSSSAIAPPAATTTTEEPAYRKAARYAWALLLAHIYDQRKSPWDEVFPLLCSRCGGEMRIIAFITQAVVIRKILGHLVEQISPPAVKPARGPSLWEMQQDAQPEIDPHAQPSLAYEFDQRIAW